MNKENIVKIGNYCKEYRTNILQLTLTDVSEKMNVNIKNLSAFENGRANNINYLFIYWKLSTDEKQRVEFLKNMFNCL
jgi:hypothetical protein